MELTDEQWEVVREYIPTEELKRPGRQGGRPFQEARPIMDAVLWVLRTGAPWADLPRRFPPYQTCHRRYQEWVRQGVLERLLRRLAEDLRDRGKIDLTEAFIDASFSSAKKGARPSVLLAAVKGARSWRSATAMVFLSPCTWPALRPEKPRSSTPRSRSASSA